MKNGRLIALLMVFLFSLAFTVGCGGNASSQKDDAVPQKTQVKVDTGDTKTQVKVDTGDTKTHVKVGGGDDKTADPTEDIEEDAVDSDNLDKPLLDKDEKGEETEGKDNIDVNITTGKGESRVKVNTGKVSTTVEQDGGDIAVKSGDGTVYVKKGNTVTVKGQAGSFEHEIDSNINEKELGIKFYPGATVISSVTSAGDNIPGVGSAKVLTVILRSKDSVDKIKTFYKSQIPNCQVVENDGDVSIMSDPMTMAQGNMTVINIKNSTEEPGSLEISIVHKEQ